MRVTHPIEVLTSDDGCAVARLFRGGAFPRHGQYVRHGRKALASEEASYKAGARSDG